MLPGYSKIMTNIFIIALFCLIEVNSGYGQEIRKFGADGDVEITAHTVGGKIEIYSTKKESSYIPKVTFKPHAIQEVDDLEVVTSEYNEFDLGKVKYESSFPEDETVPHSYNNYTTATQITMTGYVNGQTSAVEFTIYITKFPGVSVMGDETIIMNKDSVKLLTQLKHWSLSPDTMYVQFIFEAHVSGSGRVWHDFTRGESIKNFPVMYDAMSARFQLSRNVLPSDGTYYAMPAGYPKLEEDGDKRLFVFRIPRFTDATTFDATIELIFEDFVANDFKCVSLRSSAQFLCVTYVTYLSSWVILALVSEYMI